MTLDHDQQLGLLYGLAILIFPVAALLRRGRGQDASRRTFTVQSGDETYSGVYWVEDGMVYVASESGRRGTPLRAEDALQVAEKLLIDIHRDGGALQ